MEMCLLWFPPAPEIDSRADGSVSMKPRIVCVVTQGVAHSGDGFGEAAIEIADRACRPKSFLKFLPCQNFARDARSAPPRPERVVPAVLPVRLACAVLRKPNLLRKLRTG